ncbi:hypothetical protein V0288_09180 [Pannus brasiliensis CCIBt3594]|uniref:Uncharacterized protein n=1 Tax=Pannus brasiliensis CCIBt3594 TaxID=1427578 RepID=A0AAW9QPZ0_9CHRO
MALPVTFLGENTQTGLGSEISLNPNKRYLVIPWEDIADSINSLTIVPNSLEDWIAAFVYKLISLTTSDTNATGAKITASRRFSAIDNGKSIDEGNFEANTTLALYSVLLGLYIPDSNPTRPTASSL